MAQSAQQCPVQFTCTIFSPYVSPRKAPQALIRGPCRYLPCSLINGSRIGRKAPVRDDDVETSRHFNRTAVQSAWVQSLRTAAGGFGKPFLLVPYAALSERVRRFIAVMALMAAHPDPAHLMAVPRLVEPLPQVHIFHRLLLGSSP